MIVEYIRYKIDPSRNDKFGCVDDGAALAML
jgi:hypothetical protein